MSHRVIKNQADRVKERIEKARKEAGSVNNNHVGEDTYAIDGKPGGIQVDEDTSASSSYFGQYGRQDSISMMDNSAAAMFGFHTTAKNEETEQNYKTESTTNKSRRQNSISMDNSAAALFGLQAAATAKNENEDEDAGSFDDDAAALFFGTQAVKNDAKNEERGQNYETESTTIKSPTQNAISMDNSAAALFGLRATATAKNGDENNLKSASFDDDAAALFFGTQAVKTDAKNEDTGQNYKTKFTTIKSPRHNAISMDNSAAALFGLRATAKNEDEDEDEDNLKSASFDDDAAALFYGTQAVINDAKNEETDQIYKTKSTTIKSPRQNAISMDNSAAALFGLRATTKNEDEDEANLKSESVDADIAAAALFYGAVADDTNTLKFKSQRIDDENKIGKKISQLSTQSDEKTSSVGDSDIDTIDIDDLLSDDDSDEKNAREHAQPPKKSWLDDSDSDDSSVDSEIEQIVALKSPVISPATNRSWLDHLKPDRSPVNNNSKQPEKKKSWLDDSDSDDSSSDSELGRKERPTASPNSPENKKSRLDDLEKKDKKTKKSKDGNDKESKKGDKKKIGKKEKSKSCDTKKKGKKVAKMIVDVSNDGRERKKNVKKKEKSREIPTKLEAGNFSASEFDYDFDDDVIQVHHKKKKKNYEPKEKRSKDTRKSNKKKSSKKKEKNK